MLSGRTCNEISLIERHVRLRSSGKLSGSLGEKKKETMGEEFALHNSFFFNSITSNACKMRILPQKLYEDT